MNKEWVKILKKFHGIIHYGVDYIANRELHDLMDEIYMLLQKECQTTHNKKLNCGHFLKEHTRMKEAKASSDIEGAKTNKSICELIDMKDNMECNHTSQKVETKSGEYCMECRYGDSGWEEELFEEELKEWNLTEAAIFYITGRVTAIIQKQREEERQRICEELEKLIKEYRIFAPDCGYESEEEKGFQKGMTAGEKLMQKNLIEAIKKIKDK